MPYEDLEPTNKGCFFLMLRIIAVILVALTIIWLLIGCSSSPAVFRANIKDNEGKVVYYVEGIHDPGRSWVEQNLGPVGQVLEAFVEFLKWAAPTAAATASIP